MKSLAIVGAGCSGLVTLKHALEELKGWTVVCFEASNSIRGTWGLMPERFRSTSTKFTTQFACYPKYSAETNGCEFFRGSEFGDYLKEFAEAFSLRPHIRLNTKVQSVQKSEAGWELTVEGETEHFDAIVICTGLNRRPLHDFRQVTSETRGETIVVVGGGESAVDLADHLSDHNRVYLSLRSGMRLSPRYHPIRGVPSDFLRTRLMESIDRDLRNSLGRIFVDARIRFEQTFRRLSGASRQAGSPKEIDERRHWELKLKARAKDELFNTFHNKSDDFLQAVASGRLTIIGQPVDAEAGRFWDFDETEVLELNPDKVLYRTGYNPGLHRLVSGFRLTDLHLGCLHRTLFAVGMMRPVLGNIPSLSELQARYVVGILAESFPHHLSETREEERARLGCHFPKVDLERIYPVEYFRYAEELAGRMGSLPTRGRSRPWRDWLRLQLVPFSTGQYLNSENLSQSFKPQTIYLPPLLIVLLCLVKGLEPVFLAFKGAKRILAGLLLR